MDGRAFEPTTPAHSVRSSELLGFPADARVLIINLDDLGMYHAVNAAVVHSIEEGIATSHYRWGPLTAKEKVPSLLDETGGLFTPDQVPQLLAQARLDEVELEFRAQVNAVAGAGLTPTHWTGTAWPMADAMTSST